MLEDGWPSPTEYPLLMLEGLMQDFPLTVHHIFWRAERLFGDKQIVSALGDGSRHRYAYADMTSRVRRLAGALLAGGVKPGDRIATFAWNHYRHLELYFAVPMIGAVLHTLNIRLHPDQLAYIANHAEDSWVFYDPDLTSEKEAFASEAKAVERWMSLDDDYEALLDSAEPLGDWPEIDEMAAAGMCYTSGTTGDPKGVLYSHRSTFLHAMGTATGNANGFMETDTTLAVVPMFHAMAWGQPYAATMSGCKQVYPGPHLAPDRLVELIETEQVTLSAGVPTVWIGVLDELDKGGHDLSSLRFINSGGAPCPRSVIEGFARHGIDLLQGWGMTETSPVCALGHLRSSLVDLPEDERFRYLAKTGFMIPGVEFRIVDDVGSELPWDGEAFGELQVKGPWIASAYYQDPRSAQAFDDGWLKTGDVATVDQHGYFQIVDRTKDLVKSGGEWISSVELEKEIMGHPEVIEAAVIGTPDEKWGERPLALVVARPGAELSKQDVISHLEGKVADWWLPDEVVFIDEVPKTSVGKFDKRALRERFVAG